MNRNKGENMDAPKLRKKIVASLKAQGFRIDDGEVLPPEDLSKARIRALHETAVEHRQQRSEDGLYRKENALLQYVASGDGIEPHCVSPCLIEVMPGSEEELLFRYASLHWSIPTSSGYGRRIRFLVLDEHNGKLIGILGLGDPVFNLGPRDDWIGWNKENRRKRLRYVMDAFVLGAVPPYSFLLCGKLVAMLAACDEVREAVQKKYGGRRPVIRRTPHDGRLALITTTSALGRSSLYNRVRLGRRTLYHSAGFTQGYGEFHFSNGLYSKIREFAAQHCEPTAKRKEWGSGFRNRREVIRKCLPALGLSSEWLNHGVEREVFLVPLAKNARQFLCGKRSRLHWYHQSASDMWDYFRDRWMLPRASWDERYRGFDAESYHLWRSE